MSQRHSAHRATPKRPRLGNTHSSQSGMMPQFAPSHPTQDPALHHHHPKDERRHIQQPDTPIGDHSSRPRQPGIKRERTDEASPLNPPSPECPRTVTIQTPEPPRPSKPILPPTAESHEAYRRPNGPLPSTNSRPFSYHNPAVPQLPPPPPPIQQQQQEEEQQQPTWESGPCQSPKAGVPPNSHPYQPPPEPNYAPTPQNGHATKKVPRTTVACEYCRQHKARCDNGRPCRTCIEKGVKCVNRKSIPRSDEPRPEHLKDINQKVDVLNQKVDELNRRIDVLAKKIEEGSNAG